MEKLDKLLRAELRAIDVKVLSACKAQNPRQFDYGLGRAGITLQRTDDMREYLIAHGISVTGKAPKTIASLYKRSVGHAADYLIAAAEKGPDYIGSYCYAGTVREFLALNMRQWLAIMRANFPTVYYGRPCAGQEQSWHATFSAMQSALRNHPAYHDLMIIFEYVLPPAPRLRSSSHSLLGVRADVILLSKGKVGIIEFKNRSLDTMPNISFVSMQANKYASRIARCHRMSQCMTISTAALMLRDRNQSLTDRETRVHFFSPDNMDRALLFLVGRNPVPHPNPDAWMRSEWDLA